MSTCTTRNKPAQFNLTNLMAVGPQLIAASISQAQQFVRLGSTMLAGTIPKVSSSCCCDIPETDCPPRCVCEIEWQANIGETLTASIRFTNSSQENTREFHFDAIQFVGPGAPQGQSLLTVTPAQAKLGPGESVNISVKFTPTAAFQPGQTYEGAVRLRGAYEQIVCITFTPEEPSRAQCSVEQGDPPVRLRAHQWYDHFQCVEPCLLPGATSKTTNLTHR